MKKLSGEQWRTLVGKRVLLVENPDNRLDVTTRGLMPAHQSSEDWQREDSEPRVKEFTVAEVAPSVRFLQLLRQLLVSDERILIRRGTGESHANQEAEGR